MLRLSLRSVSDPVRGHVCLSCLVPRVKIPARSRSLRFYSAASSAPEAGENRVTIIPPQPRDPSLNLPGERKVRIARSRARLSPQVTSRVVQKPDHQLIFPIIHYRKTSPSRLDKMNLQAYTPNKIPAILALRLQAQRAASTRLPVLRKMELLPHPIPGRTS